MKRLIKKIFPNYKSKKELRRIIEQMENEKKLYALVESLTTVKPYTEHNVERLTAMVSFEERVPVELLKENMSREMAHRLMPHIRYDIVDDEKIYPSKKLIGVLYVGKFRGKRIDNGEWAYGYYLVAGGMPFMSVFGEREMVRLVSGTVGQYTGLKDKNGVEIYEDDTDGKRVVEYWSGQPIVGWYLKCKYTGDTGYFSPLDKFEVIGNIHDNPELL